MPTHAKGCAERHEQGRAVRGGQVVGVGLAGTSLTGTHPGREEALGRIAADRKRARARSGGLSPLRAPATIGLALGRQRSHPPEREQRASRAAWGSPPAVVAGTVYVGSLGGVLFAVGDAP